MAPDPNASGRYGSSDERAHRERHAHSHEEPDRKDRLEISERARRSFQLSAAPPDMDFARKALEKLPNVSGDRRDQLVARIRTGYYQSPVVMRQIASRLLHGAP